jgi:hypothetical protein
VTDGVADEDRHERLEAARLRAELSVPELWLRYVALGGNGDILDLDAYLHGLQALGSFDQTVLAVAVNERLEELYRAARVPLENSAPTPPVAPAPPDDLRTVIAALLGPDAARPTPSPPPEDAPPTRPRPADHGDADDCA